MVFVLARITLTFCVPSLNTLFAHLAEMNWFVIAQAKMAHEIAVDWVCYRLFITLFVVVILTCFAGHNRLISSPMIAYATDAKYLACLFANFVYFLGFFAAKLMKMFDGFSGGETVMVEFEVLEWGNSVFERVVVLVLSGRLCLFAHGCLWVRNKSNSITFSVDKINVTLWIQQRFN